MRKYAKNTKCNQKASKQKHANTQNTLN